MFKYLLIMFMCMSCSWHAKAATGDGMTQNHDVYRASNCVSPQSLEDILERSDSSVLIDEYGIELFFGNGSITFFEGLYISEPFLIGTKGPKSKCVSLRELPDDNRRQTITKRKKITKIELRDRIVFPAHIDFQVGSEFKINPVYKIQTDSKYSIYCVAPKGQTEKNIIKGLDQSMGICIDAGEQVELYDSTEEKDSLSTT